MSSSNMNNVSTSSSANNTGTTNTSMESAEEATAIDARKNATLFEMARQMCNKTSKFIEGEIRAGCESYTLLEEMNGAAARKYEEQRLLVDGITESIDEVNEKHHATIQPLLKQLDQLETGVTSLEKSAEKLDEWSKALEARFRDWEKRLLAAPASGQS